MNIEEVRRLSKIWSDKREIYNSIGLMAIIFNNSVDRKRHIKELESAKYEMHEAEINLRKAQGI